MTSAQVRVAVPFGPFVPVAVEPIAPRTMIRTPALVTIVGSQVAASILGGGARFVGECVESLSC